MKDLMTREEKIEILTQQYREQKQQERQTKQNNHKLFKKYGSEYFIANDIKGE